MAFGAAAGYVATCLLLALLFEAILTLFGGGIALFALRGVHQQMLSEKEVHLARLQRKLLQPLELLTPTGAATPTIVWDANRVALLEAAERKVAAALEWPIDTAGMRGIGAIVASILAALAGSLRLCPDRRALALQRTSV